MYGISLLRRALRFLPVVLLVPMVLATGCAGDAVPALGVDAPDVDFAFVAVGATAELPVALRNEGADPVQARLSLTGSPAFELVGGDRPNVPAGGSHDVLVRFSPTARGLAEAALSARACDTCEPVTVSLVGSGLAPRVQAEPAALDFDVVDQHARADRTVALVNEGDLEATVSELRLTPAQAAFELEAPEPPFTIPAGGRVEVGVAFVPPESGPFSVRLQWAVDDPSAPIDSIAAVGRARAIPIVEAGDAVAFEPSTVGLPVTATWRLVRNTGDAPLEVTAVERISGAAFELTPLPGAVTVQPDGILPVEITFTPPALGTHDGVVRLLSNDPNTPELDLALSGEGVGPLPCTLTATPSAVDLGLVAEPLLYERSVDVTNASEEAACEVQSIRLLVDEAVELSLTEGAADEPLTLAPGESRRISLRLRAGAGRQDGIVKVETAHPATSLEVPVSGLPSTLAAVPTGLDLGTVGSGGCADIRRPLCVYPRGPFDETLQTVQVVGASEVTVSGLVPGTVIPAGDRLCGEVVVAAGTPGPVLAEVRLHLSARLHDVVVPVRADVSAGPRTERFVQAVPGAVDLLFVLDDSGAMAMEHLAAADHLSDLLAPADQFGFEWQAGVTVTDCDDESLCGALWPYQWPQDALVSSTEPDALQRLAANFTMGDSGSANEQALRAAHAALGGFGPLPRPELVRPEAQLALVVITDEPEQSANTVDFYLDWMRALKGDAHAVTVSAIAGDPPSGCSGPGGAATAAPRLLELAERTGGAFGSICTDAWGATMGSVGQQIFERRRVFFLEGTPDPTTLEVYVDGLPEAAPAWTWDAAHGAVVFSDFHRPFPGEMIEVRYAPVCG